MGAPENAALMALAESIGELKLQAREAVSVLKDILSHMEWSDGVQSGAEEEEDDTTPAPMAAPSAPSGDMGQMLAGLLAGAVKDNPALALALQGMMKSGTNDGADKKEG